MSGNNSILDRLEISTCWTIPSENKDLKGSVTVNTSNDSVQLEDVVQLETCVQLVQTNDEPCTVSICVPESSSEYIERLVVVSEGRIIELYGANKEYLSTFIAEYVDDFEDCAVYMAECKIKPTKELSIKFQKAKYPDRMWLYGMNLTFTMSQGPLSPLSSINFQAVNDMLKESKIPLSENAERCKNFLQNHAQHLPLDKLDPIEMWIKRFEARCNNSNSESGQGIACPEQILSQERNENKSIKDESSHDNSFSYEFKSLKMYVDKRFSELESRIEMLKNVVVEVETRQNEKLDCIIALLSEQKS